MPRTPVLLIILDGWGIREARAGNAVALAHTPNMNRWLAENERSIIHSSGEHVGLTPGQMGNSEVGHLNLGAGRIVYQDISRIGNAIADGSLARHPVLHDAFTSLKRAAKKLHMIGLLGDGGVHSHSDHLYALLEAAKSAGIDPVLHLITDGRDTPTQQAEHFCADLCQRLADLGAGRIATVSGRYYAMDRDQRWERTQRAYAAMVERDSGLGAANAMAAIREAYAAGFSDEFLPPTVIAGEGLAIEAGDALLCFNFRADRMRQLCRAFSKRDFAAVDQFAPVADLRLITMTAYQDGLADDVLFPVELLADTLAETISCAGKTQYHSAETEKYPHVTFFFNGRSEAPFPGETRYIVPSPKVATYDLQPEMSARQLTEATLARLDEADDDFLLVNFANPDMVGHTGSLDAAVNAVSVVDACAGKLVAAVTDKGGAAIVTADHGNCERMIDPLTGARHTYHTVAPVPLFVLDAKHYYDLRSWGRLADVAPTVLDLLDITAPPAMTGKSLIRARRSLPLRQRGQG
ncbi:MAG: 2,3-bisphosphoglycerate-independent phosphoglycerate mutase [Chloroflexi bacterium]|nr:2,3-bisphosphoglycerate-independent phosphoglycerate mutase [Chloroflexota bacterium]MCY4248477.1 2,3-bisphosphoglycerate-independent phosphoglycerate mutase [Chloroflexota bacterium]